MILRSLVLVALVLSCARAPAPPSNEGAAAEIGLATRGSSPAVAS